MGSKPNYWAVLPAQVRYDANLPPNAKLLYAEISALTNEKGYCYAGNEYFQGLYSLSERTIFRLLRALEIGGYIRIQSSRQEEGGRKIFAGLNPLSVTDKNVSETLPKMSVTTAKNVSGNNTSNSSNNPPIVPQGGEPAKPQKRRRKPREPKERAEWKPERFEAFWRFYPPVNGKRPARDRAINAWDRLRPDDETIAQMGKALQRDKNSEMWQKGIGIPYASTWLNSRAWEDEVVEEAGEVPAAGTGSQLEGMEAW